MIYYCESCQTVSKVKLLTQHKLTCTDNTVIEFQDIHDYTSYWIEEEQKLRYEISMHSTMRKQAELQLERAIKKIRKTMKSQALNLEQYLSRVVIKDEIKVQFDQEDEDIEYSLGVKPINCQDQGGIPIYEEASIGVPTYLPPTGHWTKDIQNRSQYEGQTVDSRWVEPRLPDFDTIMKIGRSCGYSIAIHGSLKRDVDLIAVPWVDEAKGALSLIHALCEGLNAKQIGTVEEKPWGRMAVVIQIDGYYKPIDLSIIRKGVPG
jgi:hypothetical protein